MTANPRALLSLLVMTATAFACAGCPERAADAGMDIKPVAVDKAGDPAYDMPPIPKDAQYTIFCRVFSDENHVQLARKAQHELHDNTPLKKWYVVHSSDHSTLYFGFYRCIDPRDPKDADEGQRAINDQNAIRSMTDSEGHRLFSECLLVGIDSPDPQANPAWDITRTKGTWSIEIATFTNTADRKSKAVDAVREARSEGIEAYYYHGPTASSVCIGCWPAEAAIEISADVQNNDPTKNLVVTNTPLAEGIAKPLQNSGINTVAPQVSIMDPTVTAALIKWQEHSVNGETRVMIDPNTHQETSQVEKSFLFKIPHKDPLDTMTPPEMVPAAPTPAPAHVPGEGQLRSLGD